MKIKLHFIGLLIALSMNTLLSQNEAKVPTIGGYKVKTGKIVVAQPTTANSPYKVVKLQTTQKFYLNSISRSKIGGRSRSYVYVQMPKNIVAWCYSFTTYRNEADAQKAANSVKIASELAKALEKTGSASAAIQLVGELVQPTGTEVCDVYVIDPNSKDNFMNGTLDGGYYESGTRLNFNAGTVGIDDWKWGNIFLGFENKSMLYGTNVALEVVAIVLNN
jgi:hypothetical protein